MKQVIHKYPLTDIHTVVEVPEGSLVLTLQLQNDTPTLWIQKPITQRTALVKRVFGVVMTGQEYELNHDKLYIGTVQMDNGIVGHVFEEFK